VAGKSGGTPAPLSDCSTIFVWELVSRVGKVIEDAVLPLLANMFCWERGELAWTGLAEQVCVGERTPGLPFGFHTADLQRDSQKQEC